MTWISLVCLLALSSSAFGRSPYGSYQASEPVVRDWPVPQRPTVAPVSYGYGQATTLPTLVKELPKMNVNYGSYGAEEQVLMPKHVTPVGGVPRLLSSFDEIVSVPKPLSSADLLCRGKRPETIIPLDDGRRFVVCLDDSKGQEQVCPKSLFYNIESKRCERRIGQIEDPCGAQGCLNGGQCVQFDVSTYQCKCAPGFDGANCELDARVCQTQQPCGQAVGTRCQSFRAGAALSYICIHQNELAYGFSAQQVTPSPCRNIDGALPLGITDKGFVMCDGERMFVESCPGGTIWDDSAKACVWPDMVGLNTITSVGDQRSISTTIPRVDYGSSYGTSEPMLPSRPIVTEQSKLVSGYGQVELPRPVMDLPKHTSSYGQVELPRPVMDLPKHTSSYGQVELPRPVMDLPKHTSSYGQVEVSRSFDLPTPSMISSYGSQPLPKTTFVQPIQKDLRTFQSSGY